jgi:hypothetical protein
MKRSGGMGQPMTSVRLKRPRPRRREPERCVPVVAIPSMQPAAPCRLSEGPNGPPSPLFLTPAATALRDSSKPDFFEEHGPDSYKLKRSARRPQRRERGR